MKTVLFSLCIWLSITLPLAAAQLHIIATADIHGRFRAFTGFAPVFARYPDAVKVDLGDLIQGTVLSDVTDGELAIELLNRMNYDLWIPGNHEFELGGDLLVRRCREFKGQVLGAQWKHEKFTPGSCTIIKRGSIRCGFIGLTEATMQFKAPLLPGFIFRDIRQVLTECTLYLRRQRCHAIILLWHNGLRSHYGTLGQLFYDFPEIDAVILGHSHKEIFSHTVGRAIAVQSGSHGRSAALLTLDFCDESSKLRRITSSLLRPAASGDAALDELITLKSRQYRQRLRQQVCYVTSEAAFVRFAAEKLCRYAKSDLAVFDYPALPSGSWSLGRLLRTYPFRNRIFKITITPGELKKFASERVPAGRRRFISGREKSTSAQVLTMAIDDFQLYSSPSLRAKIGEARYLGAVGRDLLYDSAKKGDEDGE